MRHRSEQEEIRELELLDPGSPQYGSRFVFGLFWVLLALSSFSVAAPFAAFHGVLFACVGLLILARPPILRLPLLWWVLAALFIIVGSASFLPLEWFRSPPWRENLELAGIWTGDRVVIQVRHAAESMAFFAIILITGMWLAGHRASPQQLRLGSIAFTIGVAIFAVAARLLQDSLQAGVGVGSGHFGFFPNRNHTATYLAMGVITGLGCFLQALREKRHALMAFAIVSTSVCLWAATTWSISRGGIVLIAIGCLLWLPMLGRRYLGRHGQWAVGLGALLIIGLFFIAESRVKQRISETIEKGSSLVGRAAVDPSAEDSASPGSDVSLDFRIPIALDTLDMTKDFPWTGIGAGQFRYVFPQYRNLTSVRNRADSLHPESDWLWMAAEVGLPATILLLALVLAVFLAALLPVLRGRERALRGACLVAAALVALHGVFDVPGHRVTLAWSAVFLLVLALHPPSSSKAPPGRAAVWPWRAAGFSILVAGVYLVHSHWFGGRPPAVSHASVALSQAEGLFLADQARLEALAAQGLVIEQEPHEDPVEQALAILREARANLPLDRGLWRYEAFLASQYDDKYHVVDQAFAAERALDPTWVEGVFNQARAWIAVDPDRTAILWEETMVRARELERIHPGNPWSGVPTLERMRSLVADKPELQSRLPEASPFPNDSR